MGGIVLCMVSGVSGDKNYSNTTKITSSGTILPVALRSYFGPLKLDLWSHHMIFVYL